MHGMGTNTSRVAVTLNQHVFSTAKRTKSQGGTLVLLVWRVLQLIDLVVLTPLHSITLVCRCTVIDNTDISGTGPGQKFDVTISH